MKKTTLIFVFISLALALGFSACSFSLAQDVTPPPGYQPPVYTEPEQLVGNYPESAPNPALGQAIYQEKCEPCHGEAGLGDGPMSTSLPDEVARIGAAQIAIDASPLEWFSIVTVGNIARSMPPFSGSLGPADVWDVLSYVYTFGDVPDKVAQGETIFAETCAECHGADGSGAVPGAADLTDAEHMVELSVADIAQQVSTGNGNQDHVFSTVLDAEQIENVAYYVRSLTFPLEGHEVAAAPTAEPTTEPTAEPTTGAEGADATAEVTGEPTAETTAEATLDSTEAAGDGMTQIGTVFGTVTHAAGEELPEGLEVTLEVYDHFDLVTEVSHPIEADGSFNFDGVLISPDRIYIAVVDIDGQFFPSEFYVAQEGDVNIELPITIYGTTTSTENLGVSRLHVFFQFTDTGTIQVINQVTISNRGDKMVAPAVETEPVLTYDLPEGATNLIFQQGAIGNPYIQTSTGFADPMAVLPGEGTYEIIYAYELPYSRSLEWQIPVDIPIDVAVVFVEGEQVDVGSSSLTPSGNEVLDTAVYQVLVGNDLPAGSTLDVNISGKAPNSTAGGTGDTNWIVVAAGVAGVALAGYGAWMFFRSDDRDEEEYEDDDYEYDEDEDFEETIAEAGSGEIMDEIIALDQAYENGEIDEDDYQTQRAELKALLKDALDKE